MPQSSVGRRVTKLKQCLQAQSRAKLEILLPGGVVMVNFQIDFGDGESIDVSLAWSASAEAFRDHTPTSMENDLLIHDARIGNGMETHGMLDPLVLWQR